MHPLGPLLHSGCHEPQDRSTRGCIVCCGQERGATNSDSSLRMTDFWPEDGVLRDEPGKSHIWRTPAEAFGSLSTLLRLAVLTQRRPGLVAGDKKRHLLFPVQSQARSFIVPASICEETKKSRKAACVLYGIRKEGVHMALREWAASGPSRNPSNADVPDRRSCGPRAPGSCGSGMIR